MPPEVVADNFHITNHIGVTSLPLALGSAERERYLIKVRFRKSAGEKRVVCILYSWQAGEAQRGVPLRESVYRVYTLEHLRKNIRQLI